jgi:hypothetical protein
MSVSSLYAFSSPQFLEGWTTPIKNSVSQAYSHVIQATSEFYRSCSPAVQTALKISAFITLCAPFVALLVYAIQRYRASLPVSEIPEDTTHKREEPIPNPLLIRKPELVIPPAPKPPELRKIEANQGSKQQPVPSSPPPKEGKKLDFLTEMKLKQEERENRLKQQAENKTVLEKQEKASAEVEEWKEKCTEEKKGRELLSEELAGVRKSLEEVGKQLKGAQELAESWEKQYLNEKSAKEALEKENSDLKARLNQASLSVLNKPVEEQVVKELIERHLSPRKELEEQNGEKDLLEKKINENEIASEASPSPSSKEPVKKSYNIPPAPEFKLISDKYRDLLPKENQRYLDKQGHSGDLGNLIQDQLKKMQSKKKVQTEQSQEQIASQAERSVQANNAGQNGEQEENLPKENTNHNERADGSPSSRSDREATVYHIPPPPKFELNVNQSLTPVSEKVSSSGKESSDMLSLIQQKLKDWEEAKKAKQEKEQPISVEEKKPVEEQHPMLQVMSGLLNSSFMAKEEEELSNSILTESWMLPPPSIQVSEPAKEKELIPEKKLVETPKPVIQQPEEIVYQRPTVGYTKLIADALAKRRVNISESHLLEESMTEPVQGNSSRRFDTNSALEAVEYIDTDSEEDTNSDEE